MMLGRVALAVVGVLLLGGCASGNAAGGASGSTGTLTVFAAASLTDAFGELAARFAEDHPDATVKPVLFDGSATLATQLDEGAAADVFASADEASMNSVSDLIAGTAEVFATNTLEIAVPRGNPAGIRGMADLARPGLRVVQCAPQVPCGAAARRLLSLAGVTVVPASEEQNVKAVATKVASGEADAGLVYVTDVEAARGDLDGVNIPGAERAANAYPVAALKSAADPALATAFVRWVLSPGGQAILARYGFGTP
jgi:molybdate transport system substrate-binding protein